MFCPNCQNILNNGEEFCPNCGYKVSELQKKIIYSENIKNKIKTFFHSLCYLFFKYKKYCFTLLLLITTFIIFFGISSYFHSKEE